MALEGSCDACADAGAVPTASTDGVELEAGAPVTPTATACERGGPETPAKRRRLRAKHVMSRMWSRTRWMHSAGEEEAEARERVTKRTRLADACPDVHSEPERGRPGSLSMAVQTDLVGEVRTLEAVEAAFRSGTRQLIDDFNRQIECLRKELATVREKELYEDEEELDEEDCEETDEDDYSCCGECGEVLEVPGCAWCRRDVGRWCTACLLPPKRATYVGDGYLACCPPCCGSAAFFRLMLAAVRGAGRRLVKAAGAEFQFVISDSDAKFCLDLSTGSGSVSFGASFSPAVTVTVKDADMAAMAEGSLSGKDAFLGGRLSVDGDMKLAQKLLVVLEKARLMFEPSSAFPWTRDAGY